MRIHYEEYGAGDTVLLMPGFTESARDLGAVIDALAEHYHVIAPDLPGSGRSEPQPRAYTADFYHEDARSMAALLSYLATGPVHMAGFSDGGEVALLMAVGRPELARFLVVWGAAGTLAGNSVAPVLDMIYNLIDEPTESMRGWSEHLKQRYGEDKARAMTQSWAEASRAILAAGGDISLSRISNIECPTLIIAGEYDPFCAPEMARRLASRIPTAELIIVEGAGHTVHDDRPEWFAQTLLDWLARRTIADS